MGSDTLQKLENNASSNALGGDSRDVLRHLLEVESQASALVDEAQAEADRRVAEAEKEGRARHDERYGQEAARLDGDYEKAAQAVRDEYRGQLEAYSSGLAAMPVRRADFNALAERLFFGGR